MTRKMRALRIIDPRPLILLVQGAKGTERGTHRERGREKERKRERERIVCPHPVPKAFRDVLDALDIYKHSPVPSTYPHYVNLPDRTRASRDPPDHDNCGYNVRQTFLISTVDDIFRDDFRFFPSNTIPSEDTIESFCQKMLQ